MIKEIGVKTSRRTQFVEITAGIQKEVASSGLRDATIVIFVPHTTAGVTINENADPSVQKDMLKELNSIVPFDDGYSHSEGNSAAHIKSTLTGQSVSVIVHNGKLLLGTWQGIFFCEYDGPRNRKVIIKINKDI